MPVVFQALQERFAADVAERYRVVRELGRGASAVVYLAHDRKHGREVALKVLDPVTAPASGAARFHQEIALLARLHHPHVLPLYDSGEAGGSLYFVMPYVSGESLRARLKRRGALLPGDALRVAGEVAGALAYAHAHGVVHRDVKPENVLLTAGDASGVSGARGGSGTPPANGARRPRGAPNAGRPATAGSGFAGSHALVCDFGIARRPRARGLPPSDDGFTTGAGLVLGTLDYMAPEQARGADDVDARADVWALGLVLHEMLAGRLPHADAPTPAQARASRYAGPPPSLAVPGLSRAAQRQLDTIFARALAPDPAARFATARELADAIDAVREAAAAPRPWPAWLPDTPRARRLAGASAAGIGALTVAGLVAVIRAGPAARDAAPAPQAAPAVVAVWVPPLAGGGGPDARAARVGLRARLATAIEALPEVRTIDGAASTVPGTGWRELSTAELRTRARRLGARYVAGAAVVRGPSGDELSVDLYAVDDGARLLRAVEPLAGRQPDEAAGRLGWQVVREAAARDRFLAASRRFLMGGTSSAFALAHLVQGQRKFRDANFAEAAADFERAIAADSNCAPAYHRLSVTRVWQHDFPAALAVIEAGLARRARAPADWVRLMEAQREYARRDGERAIALFQRSVVDAPANVDGWFGLSEALFHFGWFTGHDSADAERALAQLVQLDSTFAPVDNHVFDLALYRGDSAGARRALARLRTDDRQRPPRDALFALFFGTPARRAGALRDLPNANRWTLSELAAVLSMNDFAPALADTVAAALTEPGRSPDDRLRGADYRLVAGAALGGWPARLAAWEREAPDTLIDGWLATAALAGYADGGRMAVMRARARAAVAAGPLAFDLPERDERRDAFLLLAHDAATAGDSAAVRRLLGVLEPALRRAPASDPVPPAAHAALRARLALLAGDTAGAVSLLGAGLRRIDEPYTMFAPLRAMAPERMLLVTLLAATRPGDPAAGRWAASFTRSRSLADRFFAARARQAAGRP